MIVVPIGNERLWSKPLLADHRAPHTALIHKDIQYQVDALFLRMVLWSELQKICNPKLKILPMAFVLQNDWRGLPILDLSFPVYPKRTHFN